MFYVYELKDPETGQPFYVGKGKNDRAYSHLRGSKSKRVRDKIKNVRAKGFEPTVNIIEHYDDEKEAYDAEQLLISKYGRKGYDNDGILMNICEDNRPPKKTTQSAKTRAKISAAMKGKNIGKVPWNKGKEHKRGAQTPEQSFKVMKTKLIKLATKILDHYDLVDDNTIAKCREQNIIAKNSPISERALLQYIGQSIMYKADIHQ